MITITQRGHIMPLATGCRHITKDRHLTCPTTGFWQAEQIPLEDVWTPCRVRSDCSSPSMLSNEPPEEGCGGVVAAGCSGAVTTGMTGAAGCGRRQRNDARLICVGGDLNSSGVCHSSTGGERPSSFYLCQRSCVFIPSPFVCRFVNKIIQNNSTST